LWKAGKKEWDSCMQKRILIVTDFSPNENGFAGPQTTYHFVKLLEKNFECKLLVHQLNFKLLGINEDWVANKDFQLFEYFIDVNWNNRFYKILNFFKKLFNPRFFHFSNKNKAFIVGFEPEIIIGIPNSPFLYKALINLKSQIPYAKLFCYIMDDYKLYDDFLVKNVIQKSFNKIEGWISISENMASLFQTKFKNLKNKSYTVLQNPVPLDRMLTKKTWSFGKKSINIVYAGSVYPNHLDGLLQMIDSINDSDHNVFLDIYTKEEFRHHFQKFESSKVCYKGSIAYRELTTILHHYDFGLVTETFTAEFAHFARSSIQTKINDYLLAGCMIIAFGPTYGACVQYILQNRLGLVLTNNQKGSILDFLDSLPTKQEYIDQLREVQENWIIRVKESENLLIQLLNK
jgi:hypothetical protein